MIDPHIHCASCFREIATKIKVAGGKTKDVDIATATTFEVLPGPGGIGVVPRQVPICDECRERAEKLQAQAASKLIVPGLRPVQ